MCQLNVYMIDKFVPGIDDKYNYYEASANRCDCGSVVGLIRDYREKFKTYKDYLESMQKHELIKLYMIKEILMSEDYEKRLTSVLATRDRMFSRIEEFTKELKEKEARLSELTIRDNPNIKEQIEIKKLKQQIMTIKKSLDNNHQYLAVVENYNEFIRQNELLILSRNYTLDYKKDWWQENIDLKISKTEHESHIHTNAEFNHLKFILGDVLKLTDEVKLFSILQEQMYNI